MGRLTEGDGRDDLVSVSRSEYNALQHAMQCWTALCESPHVSELIAELMEWRDRADFRETSSSISTLAKWGQVGPTYAELERRRSTYSTPALSPEQIRTQAAASWAAIERRAA